MAEQERDFKGVWIPKAIWLDDRLTALDKVILVEIDSLDQTERGCYASNKYVADFCQCSETKVSQSIAKLVKLNYIYVKAFDGRQRELKSSFTKNDMQPYKKCEADLQKVQESNIDNKPVNKPVNNNIEGAKPKRAKFIPPVIDECITVFKENGSTENEANAFFDYYEANGWTQGKGKAIKDWKAAARGWIRRSAQYNYNTQQGGAADGNHREESARLIEENGYGYVF